MPGVHEHGADCAASRRNRALPGQVFSPAAAALFEAPVPHEVPGNRIDIAVSWPRTPLQTRGIRGRPESRMQLLLIASGLPEPLIADPIPVAGGILLHPNLKLTRWTMSR